LTELGYTFYKIEVYRSDNHAIISWESEVEKLEKSEKLEAEKSESVREEKFTSLLLGSKKQVSLILDEKKFTSFHVR